MLNLVLLFVVLFFVYPLKFLFSRVFDINSAALTNQQTSLLFLIYGLGFAAVQLVFALFYLHAYRRGNELQFSACERYVTGLSIGDHVTGMAISGPAQVLPPAYLSIAGFTYFLIAVHKSVTANTTASSA